MPLDELLNERRSKLQWLHLFDSDRMHFYQAIDLAILSEEEKGWRAAWLLYHRVHRNDQRLQPHLTALIRAVAGKRDGHQRELLKVIGKMKRNETQEGELFDICLRIWEDTGKQPSVRVTAFRMMVDMAWRYPDLKSELIHFAEPHYTASLSPGIKNSVDKLLRKLEK